MTESQLQRSERFHDFLRHGNSIPNNLMVRTVREECGSKSEPGTQLNLCTIQESNEIQCLDRRSQSLPSSSSPNREYTKHPSLHNTGIAAHRANGVRALSDNLMPSTSQENAPSTSTPRRAGGNITNTNYIIRMASSGILRHVALV
jgi:hypothetical protein